MYRHRLARTGVVLAILFVGCGQSRADRVTAGTPSPAAATKSTTPTTAVPVPTTTATGEPAPPAIEATATVTQRPAVQPATTAALEPATITVKYEPHDGGTATATLVETGANESLADGSAVFADLADGTYTVQIQVVYPIESAGDTAIGAQSVFKSHRIAVQAGDHAVVACDDSDCTGIS